MDRQLHRSFSVQDNEDCSADHHQSFYQADQFEQQLRNAQDSQEYGSRNEQRKQQQQDGQSKVKPVKKTRAMESHDKICFSTSKVNECSSGSQPDESEEKSVEFVCIQRSNIDARRLMRSIQSAKRYQQVEGEKSEDAAIQREISDLKSELVGSAGVQKISINVPQQCTESRRRR